MLSAHCRTKEIHPPKMLFHISKWVERVSPNLRFPSQKKRDFFCKTLGSHIIEEKNSLKNWFFWVSQIFWTALLITSRLKVSVMLSYIPPKQDDHHPNSIRPVEEGAETSTALSGAVGLKSNFYLLLPGFSSTIHTKAGKGRWVTRLQGLGGVKAIHREGDTLRKTTSTMDHHINKRQYQKGCSDHFWFC